MRKFFYPLVERLAEAIGNPFSLLVVFVFLTIAFGIGIFTGYSETWFKLVEFIIYVCTFIIVFIIEISEQTDTKAIHVKLDEIIKSLPQVDNQKAGIEHILKSGESLEKVMEKHKRVNKRKERRVQRVKIT
jgi:low affinity Fe/Cu permease